MATWTDSRGRQQSRSRGHKVELLLQAPPADAVIISSNPALHVPNFDKCRRDCFCRCRDCKPPMVNA